MTRNLQHDGTLPTGQYGEGGSSDAMLPGLRADAIEIVLSRLPDEQYQQWKAKVANNEVSWFVPFHQLWGRAKRSTTDKTIIYVNPIVEIIPVSIEAVIGLVAHEMAHVLLGHMNSSPENESAADQALREWGFSHEADARERELWAALKLHQKRIRMMECKECQTVTTEVEQSALHARLRDRGFTLEQANEVLPRCPKCVARIHRRKNATIRQREVLNRSRNHDQVDVEYDGETIQVDEGLSELLTLIWRQGIHTINSCQENEPGLAWIDFETAVDFTKFLNLVATYPDETATYSDTLYARIMQHPNSVEWKYKMDLDNYGVDEEVQNNEIVDKNLGFNAFEIAVSVRFPVSDIAVLTDILRNRPS